MPDLERLTRSLELHLASTPEAVAFTKGRQAGEDRARWQVVAFTATIAVAIVLLAPMLGLELPQQVEVLQGLVKDHGIDRAGPVLNLFMMGVLLDLDGGSYPAELVARVDSLSAFLRAYNQEHNPC